MAEDGGQTSDGALFTGDAENSITYQIQADLIRRTLDRLQTERVTEEQLKQKIMKDMLSSVHPDTTQFILDMAEAQLVKIREFIENFLSYKGSSGLAELWAQVQQLLDMLQPFTQLPGVVIPGVGDVSEMVNQFATMQKIIYDSLTEEEKKKLKKKVEEEKKSKKRPTLAQKIGKELEDQADQTWEAVQILIDEIPRIKEDLYMMCLENSWGLIVKICKMLGIPIDMFPFNLLAELPEIEKLARDLRRNGKKMIKEAFGNMMLPIYLARSFADSLPLDNDRKLSVVCSEIVDNKYQTEYYSQNQDLIGLKLKKTRYERQKKELENKIKQVNKRLRQYENSKLGFQKTFELINKEAASQLSVLDGNIQRVDEAIPQKSMVVDKALADWQNTSVLFEEAYKMYAAAKKSVDDKNAETLKAIKAAEMEKEKRKQAVMQQEKAKEVAAVAGTDDPSDGQPPEPADYATMSTSQLMEAGSITARKALAGGD